MKKFTLFFLLTFICNISFSQTAVTGGIYTNTVWPKSGNPYIVTGTVVAFPNVTLTIDPGVIVKFNSGGSLEIRGQLVAIGNVSDSITFTSNSSTPTKGSWDGVKAIGTTNPLGVGNQITMDYVKGMYAYRFIDMDLAYHGPYIFKHSYFANNTVVNHDGGDPITTFENCKFVSNTLGLDVCQFASRVSNSEFINNQDGLKGFDFIDTCYFTGNYGTAMSPYGKTRGCTIVANNIGVNCYFNAVNNTFINNNVSNNYNGVEILSYFNGSINFTNNFICNNSNYNIKMVTTNNADLSNNCWCTNNTGIISSKIYDGYVNTAYGLVNFTPYNTNCTITGLNENSESSNTIAVFPNPFDQVINISLEDNKPSEIILLDVTSREVARLQLSQKTSISTEGLSSGVYMYRIINEGKEMQHGKVIKE